MILLAACTRQEPASDLPHATAVLRDGTTVAGRVASTTPGTIVMNLDGGGTRTIATKDLRRMDYDEPPATAAGRPAAPGSAPAAPVEPSSGDRQHAAAAAIQSVTRVLPVGTELPVRTQESIDSSKAVEGQIFAAEIARDVKDADGAVVIPRGANAQMVIKSASRGGKIKGAPDLVLDMRSVSIEGQQYRLDTADIVEKGRQGIGANKRTAEFAGGGAAIGSIIGAIAGGGKGAAIGAGAGAGAGAAGQVLTRGSIKIPPETVLTYKLDGAFRMVASQ